MFNADGDPSSAQFASYDRPAVPANLHLLRDLRRLPTTPDLTPMI